MLRRSNFRSLYTSGKAYGNLGTASKTTWGKEASCVASTFFGKFASITAVDLIQRKKLDSWKIFESNLAEARFEII